MRIPWAVAPFLSIAREDLEHSPLSPEYLNEADEVLSARAAKIGVSGSVLSGGGVILASCLTECGRASVLAVIAWSLIVFFAIAFIKWIPIRLLRGKGTLLVIAVALSFLDIALGFAGPTLAKLDCEKSNPASEVHGSTNT